MSRSLQAHLSRTLSGAILLAALVAAATSFALAYDEAREFQDDMLRQVATLAAVPSAALRPGPPPHPHKDDARLSVVHLPGEPRPTWLAAQARPGLSTVDTPQGRLRVYLAAGDGGALTVVSQPTEVRDEIAIDSALRTLIPLLLLLPVLGWLVVRIVRRELAPVIRLAHGLDQQPAGQPSALAGHGLPSEITPFVDAINRLLVRVNALMQEQRRFIADAAHELRSPLTAISLQAQNLHQADSLDTVRQRLLPLQDGIERARRLTEQLLSLARAQSDGAAPVLVDAGALARELLAECMPLAESRNIDVGLEQSAPLSLQASPEGLRSIVRNALENALLYTQAGGQVSLRLRAEGADDLIEVVDNGPGIAPAERARVFDAFYRLPGAAGQGSGIGLAIARESALRLGGTLTLHARDDGPGLIVRYRQARP